MRADGTGQVGHAGSALLAGSRTAWVDTGAVGGDGADQGAAPAHDPGVVLRDLAVMLADGGEAVTWELSVISLTCSEVRRLNGVPRDRLDRAECLGRLRVAVASEGGAWKLGARPQRRAAGGPERTVLDWTRRSPAHSEKEDAKGNFKGGYGHHPLLCYLEGQGRRRRGCCGGQRRVEHRERSHAGARLALAQPSNKRSTARSW